uniref:Uncharacterized protein n=1 Tax=Chromera velia CCMP2878 TaxID=1169474 RepID=A0A0G4G9F9_9ALVE|eukprot:Cvel_4383.t1-p1 / transcript=Cvel_4383.t1 / gene=Cvel_4383 / organism=Chromera_velia_CCMP2878 / gene_product=hypothetical protein / transcript_product=hypothetical protein / location=Cvel_scaffold190:33684-35745(+) / protein_length=412 / sequence_SO=supercontig / SO=protein_coding / is_pseudo=false
MEIVGVRGGKFIVEYTTQITNKSGRRVQKTQIKTWTEGQILMRSYDSERGRQQRQKSSLSSRYRVLGHSTRAEDFTYGDDDSTTEEEGGKTGKESLQKATVCSQLDDYFPEVASIMKKNNRERQGKVKRSALLMRNTRTPITDDYCTGPPSAGTLPISESHCSKDAPGRSDPENYDVDLLRMVLQGEYRDRRLNQIFSFATLLLSLLGTSSRAGLGSTTVSDGDEEEVKGTAITDESTSIQTNESTPSQTDESTPIQTNESTPNRMNESTPIQTDESTPIQTNEKTGSQTNEANTTAPHTPTTGFPQRLCECPRPDIVSPLASSFSSHQRIVFSQFLPTVTAEEGDWDGSQREIWADEGVESTKTSPVVYASARKNFTQGGEQRRSKALGGLRGFFGRLTSRLERVGFQIKG